MEAVGQVVAEERVVKIVLQCDYGSGWEDEDEFPDTEAGNSLAKEKFDIYQLGAVEGYSVRLIRR